MSEWKPIDTAPKNGTWILAFVLGAQIPAVVQWQDFEKWTDTFKEASLQPRWLECIEGNFENDQEALNHLSNTQYSPTHWMPLPTPPENEIDRPL